MQTVESHQFQVRAPLDDSSAIHHSDAMHNLDGAQAMRDYHRRAALHQPVEGLLYQGFRVVVQGASSKMRGSFRIARATAIR